MPIHLGREDPRIKIADAGSKAPDSDDWSIDKVSFQNLSQKFGPFTIDLFAEEANYRVPRFYSSFMTLSSEGVNAFSHSWDNEEALICPPVNKIIQVFRKIKLTKGQGLLIVPKWLTSRFWPFLLEADSQPAKPFELVIEFFPEITQNQRARLPLSGTPKFGFLAFFYNTLG